MLHQRESKILDLPILIGCDCRVDQHARNVVTGIIAFMRLRRLTVVYPPSAIKLASRLLRSSKNRMSFFSSASYTARSETVSNDSSKTAPASARISSESDKREAPSAPDPSVR